MTIKRIPTSAIEDWARAYSLVAQVLLDACELEPLDPSYRISVIRAAKWYSCLPQLILRQPGKGTRDGRILLSRLHQILTGNFKPFVVHWYLDSMKQRAKNEPCQSRSPKIYLSVRWKRFYLRVLDGVFKGLKVTAVLKGQFSTTTATNLS